MSMYVRARAYVSDEDGQDWAEMEAGAVEVQRTEENEVRVGLRLRDADVDCVTLYLTVSEASRLAHLFGVAVLANEAAAHEAASIEAGPVE